MWTFKIVVIRILKKPRDPWATLLTWERCQSREMSNFAKLYDYTITLNNQEKRPYMENWMVLNICLKLNRFHQRMLWLKFAQWFSSRRLLNCVNVSIFPISVYLPLKRGVDFEFIWTNLNSFLPKDTLCQVWLKFAQKPKMGKDRRRTTGDQKISLELSAQVS